MSYLTVREVQEIGFNAVGDNVQLSRRASFYSPDKIRLGSNVRIDDYCVLSAGDAGISIGSFVHLAPFCLLTGAARITLSDFSGLSSRVSIYSSTDDYSGEHLTNPTVPRVYRGVRDADVTVGRHSIIGASTVILPGCNIADGAAVGAMSLVTRDLPSFSICGGIPAVVIKPRCDALLAHEEAFRSSLMHR